jgi:hypothetical protein
MTSRALRNAVGFLSILALGLGLPLAGGGQARAGTHGAFAYCTSTPGKSFCYGSLAGFVADSDPSSYASFNTESSTSASFSAHVGGRDFGCTVSPTLYPDVLALWPRTTSFDSLFVIMWDQQGYCSSLSLHNSSAYR